MPVTNVKSKWISGNLQFRDNSGNRILEIDGPNRRIEPYAIGMVDSEEIQYGTAAGGDAVETWNGSYMEFAPGSGFWATCPHLAYPDASLAFHWFEDFIGNVSFPAATGSGGGWKAVGDATYDVLAAAGTTGGIITLAPETASNNEVYFQLGEKGTETFIEYVKDSGLKSWVEFRLTYTRITSAASAFVGVAEQGCAVANWINDTGDSFADKDLVGFVIWEADPNAIDCNTRISGAATEDYGLAAVPVAGTYLNLGLYFDGAETLSFYVDDAVVQTADLDDSSFPTDEEMAPIIALKNGDSDASISIDWIRVVSER